MNITTRPAKKEDKETARIIHHLAFHDVVVNQFGYWNEEHQDSFFDLGWYEANHEMILCDEKVCGFISVVYTQDCIRIFDIALHPDYQGKGIGSQMLQNLINEAKIRKVPVKLRVLFKNRAFELYKRLDFVETGRDKTHIEMERSVIKE